MPRFGKTSKEKRELLCNDLKRLVDEVIKEYDFSIVETHRGKAEQERAFNLGFSKAHFMQSAHNPCPAYAVDVYPYPTPKVQHNGNIELDSNSPEWDKMINVFKRKANELGIKITCGIDFKSFKDKPHLELADWKERVKKI